MVDASEGNLAADRATGFVFERAQAPALSAAIRRAIGLHAQPERWRRVMAGAMAQDYSWSSSAEHYETLYRELLPENQSRRPFSST